MAIDTPAKIAILGAGPIGLEAGLYARFLGYDVEIFDRGEVADNIRRWGHVRMFTPFGRNASPLGIAALEAQDEQFQAPNPDAMLTGAEWRERYLLPLSQSDLLADHLRLRTAVVAVARDALLKSERFGTEDRGDSPFRMLLRQRDGLEWETTADIVIDASGVYGNPNWMGRGGAPAIGERSVRERMDYEIPDVLGKDRQRFANKQVLVIGQGHSAATSIVALQSLAESESATRVTWTTRRPSNVDEPGPVRPVPSDNMPERSRLVEAANAAARDPRQIVTHWPETAVNSVLWDDSRGLYEVEFSGEHASRGMFDQIIANVGYRPDLRVFEELQVQLCPATGAPIHLAAQALAAPPDVGGQQGTSRPVALLTGEPNFYILGAKSFGRSASFLLETGIEQIRDLFTIIGDRQNLDLYKGAKRLGE